MEHVEEQKSQRKMKTKFMIDDILQPVQTESNEKSKKLQTGSQTKVVENADTLVKAVADLPAWIFCTRYSDRPSAGPRQSRKGRFHSKKLKGDIGQNDFWKRENRKNKKRPRTAFSRLQIDRLQSEFDRDRYLTETRRSKLAEDLGLAEDKIKIWFQNKRAKVKRNIADRSGPGQLAQKLMEQGLYRHSSSSD